MTRGLIIGALMALWFGFWVVAFHPTVTALAEWLESL